MTSLHPFLRTRATMDVPWDGARERRVLDRALDARRERARRTLAFELAAAMVAIFLLGRVLPRGDLASPRSESAAKQTKSRSIGGFAGTGGHGGTGSTGQGGNAGTG